MIIDVDPGRRSDRAEVAFLHHDIAHNPANGFNFRSIGCRPRRALSRTRCRRGRARWSATVFRLIEAPIGQIKDVSLHNPFQAPVQIELALPPPAPDTYAKRLPSGTLPELWFEYALLRRGSDSCWTRRRAGGIRRTSRSRTARGRTSSSIASLCIGAVLRLCRCSGAGWIPLAQQPAVQQPHARRGGRIGAATPPAACRTRWRTACARGGGGAVYAGCGRRAAGADALLFGPRRAGALLPQGACAAAAGGEGGARARRAHQGVRALDARAAARADGHHDGGGARGRADRAASTAARAQAASTAASPETASFRLLLKLSQTTSATTHERRTSSKYASNVQHDDQADARDCVQ